MGLADDPRFIPDDPRFIPEEAAEVPTPTTAVSPPSAAEPTTMTNTYKRVIGPAIREGYKQNVAEPVSRGIRTGLSALNVLDIPEPFTGAAEFTSRLFPQNVPQLLGTAGGAAGLVTGGPVGGLVGAGLGGYLGGAIEGRDVGEQYLLALQEAAGQAGGEVVFGKVLPWLGRALPGMKERISNLSSYRLGGEIEKQTGVPINPQGPPGPRAGVDVGQSSVRLRNAASGDLVEAAQKRYQEGVDTIEGILTQSTGPHSRIVVSGQPGPGQIRPGGTSQQPGVIAQQHPSMPPYTTPTFFIEGKDMTFKEGSKRLSEVGERAFDPYLTSAERTIDGKDARDLYKEIREQLRGGLGRHPLAQRTWDINQGQYERSRAWSDMLRGQVEGMNVGNVFEVPRNRLAAGWGGMMDAAASVFRGTGGTPAATTLPVRVGLPGAGNQYAVDPNAMLNMGTLQSFMQQPVGRKWAMERFGPENYESIMKVLLPGRQPLQPSTSTQGVINALSQQILNEFTGEEVAATALGRPSQRIPQ